MIHKKKNITVTDITVIVQVNGVLIRQLKVTHWPSWPFGSAAYEVETSHARAGYPDLQRMKPWPNQPGHAASAQVKSQASTSASLAKTSRTSLESVLKVIAVGSFDTAADSVGTERCVEERNAACVLEQQLWPMPPHRQIHTLHMSVQCRVQAVGKNSHMLRILCGHTGSFNLPDVLRSIH